MVDTYELEDLANSGEDDAPEANLGSFDADLNEDNGDA